jgi:hypothetical protein
MNHLRNEGESAGTGRPGAEAGAHPTDAELVHAARRGDKRVGKDPLGTLDWASQLPAEHRLAAGGAAFASWRGAQPEQAMKWLRELPVEDPRREAYFRDSVQWLVYDPLAIEMIVDGGVSRFPRPQENRS